MKAEPSDLFFLSTRFPDAGLLLVLMMRRTRVVMDGGEQITVYSLDRVMVEPTGPRSAVAPAEVDPGLFAEAVWKGTAAAPLEMLL